MKKYNFFTILFVLFTSFSCVENEISLPPFEPRPLNYEVIFNSESGRLDPDHLESSYHVFNSEQDYINYLDLTLPVISHPCCGILTPTAFELRNLPIDFNTETLILLFDETKPNSGCDFPRFWVEEATEFESEIEIRIKRDYRDCIFFGIEKPIIVFKIPKTSKVFNFIDLN